MSDRTGTRRCQGRASTPRSRCYVYLPTDAAACCSLRDSGPVAAGGLVVCRRGWRLGFGLPDAVAPQRARLWWMWKAPPTKRPGGCRALGLSRYGLNLERAVVRIRARANLAGASLEAVVLFGQGRESLFDFSHLGVGFAEGSGGGF